LLLITVICFWGLIERQSTTIQQFQPILKQVLNKDMLLDPLAYRVEVWTICYHYFLLIEAWFAMVLVLLAGPNLISQDLRYNALPLYLSRPMRRIDYFMGKLGIIVALLGMVIVVPSIVAYVMGLLFSLDITILRDTFRILLASVAFGLLISVSAGLLVLALSSISRNSRYVALMWIGVWFISTTVSVILIRFDQEMRLHAAHMRHRAWYSEQNTRSELERGKSDWRPVVSYTANFTRIQQHMLGTNAAWERLSKLSPTSDGKAFFLRRMQHTQYPWYWSAAVLFVVFLISVFILNLSVKSLHRLK
jgi:ABC-2 type transport system permease protein